jgi:hypothetical protein
MDLDMAKNNRGGSIGTSSQLTTVGVPDLGPGKLNIHEKRQMQSFRKHQKRMEEDPQYAAKVLLKRQLSIPNSTTTAYAKAAKKKITLPKFSWQTDNQN